VKRFGDLCENYTECVAREAELRERGEVLDLTSFLPHRRNNSAVLLCFSLVEYILGIDLEEEVYENEVFMDAYWAACDHVCWANVSPNPCYVQVAKVFCLTIFLLLGYLFI
jgi:hypothetical protein